MKQLSIIEKISLLVSAILIVIACAINPVTGKKQFMLMTEAQEVQLGAQYDPQVIATFGEYRDDELLTLLPTK